MIGKKFNKLLVLERVKNDKFGNTKWLCKCECGNKVEVLGTHLRSGHTQSCGCLQKEKCKNIIHKPKHNMSRTRIYKIWNGMKNRTNEKSVSKDKYYKNYSGRGITVCDDWKEFEQFYKWATNNGYKDNLTIDRIDTDGNYEPSNCRWITMKEQNNNKRNNVLITHNNETHNITEWNEILGFTKGLLKNRLNRGWSIQRAFTTKVGGNYGK